MKYSEVAQSYLTLCDTVDCSLPAFSHGIFQARVLEWVAISFSRGSFPPRDLNPGLPRCRQTLYHLSHQGSPKKGVRSVSVPSFSFFLWCPLFPLPFVEKLIHCSLNCLSFFVKDKLIRFVGGLFLSYFSSVVQSCLTLWDPMNCSTPGLLVHHQLREFTQTHVYRVGDAIQPSHPLSSPSPPAPNPSQHQSLSQWVNFSHEMAKVLEFQL